MKKFMAVFYLIINLPLAAAVFFIWSGETEGNLGDWKLGDESEKIGIYCMKRMDDWLHTENGNREEEKNRKENWKESENENGRGQRCFVKEVPGGKIRIPLAEGEKKEISSISLCGEWKEVGTKREWVTVVRIIRK